MKGAYPTSFFLLLILLTSFFPMKKGWSAELKTLFGEQAVPVPAGVKHVAAICWNDMKSRDFKTSEPFETICETMPAHHKEIWHTIVKKYPAMDEMEQLRTVSGFFNMWHSKKDISIYGQKEYWANPKEFIQNQGGDCEDYAIIKYEALKSLGKPADSMWIVTLFSTSRNDFHAVLAVQTSKGIYILDNLSRPKYLILPEKQYSKVYIPHFAINDVVDFYFPSTTQGLIKIPKPRN